MNRLRQQTLDQTACGLDHLSDALLNVGGVARHRALRVLFAAESQVDATRLKQQLFKLIIVEGFVTIDNAADGQIKLEDFQAIDIANGSWSQENSTGCPVEVTIK